jgi:Bacterial Ig-like domain (group 3)
MVRPMVQDRRRRGGRRAFVRRAAPALAVLGIAAVVVVVIAGAVSQISRASVSYRRTVDQGFAALAAPLVAQSNATGVRLEGLLRNAPSLGRVELFSDLDTLASAGAATGRQFDEIAPPYPSGPGIEPCKSAMDTRARASTLFRDVIERFLGGPNGTGAGAGNASAAVIALSGVATQLQGADESWSECRASLARSAGSARLATSIWVSDPSASSPDALTGFVAAMGASGSLAAQPGLAILSAVSVPAPAPGSSGVLQVPPATSIAVDVVVQDAGNVDEPSVEVTGSLTPTSAGVATTATVSSRAVGKQLRAGGSVALTLSGLRVAPGLSYQLVISASSSNVQSQSVTMPIAVEQAVTTVVVVAPATSLVTGEKVTYTATLSASLGGLPPPGGTIQFQDDGNPIQGCTAEPATVSAATCSVSYPTPGTHAVTAQYSGDQSRSGSMSSALIEKVSPPARSSRSGTGASRGM